MDNSFLGNNADISDIIGDNQQLDKIRRQQPKAQDQSNQGVINFYDEESEDLSMLKEILSQRNNELGGGNAQQNMSQN